MKIEINLPLLYCTKAPDNYFMLIRRVVALSVILTEGVILL